MAVTLAPPVTNSSGALTTTGMGSGIDVNGLVSKLMAVEQIPLTQLQTEQAADEAKITAYGSLNSAVSGFQTAVQSLNSASTFSAQTVSVGNSSVAAASADGTAVIGSHTLAVQYLAASQILESGTAYSSTSTQIGTGTLTVKLGTYSTSLGVTSFTQNSATSTQTINISANQGSLAGIRDAINAANIGVTASIMNDGTGNRLILTSSSGAKNALQITTSSGISALAYDASTGGTSNMTQTQAAQDAQFTLDGVNIAKSSNTVTDALSGVTLNLTGTNPSTPTTFTVSANTAAISTAVSNLVSAYNSAISTINGLTSFDATTNTGSVLLGDFTTQSVVSQMRSTMNTSIGYTSSGNVSSLADLGVTFNKDGTLSLNSTTLANALANPASNVASLFLALGKPTDSLVSYTSSTANTQAGNYAVNVTQTATHAQASSSVSTLPASIAADQTLALTIDGVSGTVSIPSGSFTTTALQTAINGTSAFSNAGVSATVGLQAGKNGSAAPGTTTISAGSNDNISVTLDGTTINNIALTDGTYTATSLAAMVQSAINSAFNGTASVTVTQNNGILSINSNTVGPTSAISVADGTTSGAAANLFGASPTATSQLTIASNSFGSSSGVSVTGGTAAPALFGISTEAGTTTTHGQASSSVSTLPSSIAADQTLALTINSVSGTVSVPSGSYATNADLATALQTAINGTSAFSNAGVSATVGLQAGSTGSAAPGTTTISALSNDNISVTLDGTAINNIALTDGTYTATSLAAMVQSAINSAFSGTSSSVTVTQNNGILSINSNTVGPTSAISVTDGTTSGAAANLFGATPTATSQLTIASNSVGPSSGVSVTGGTAAPALFGISTEAGLDTAGTIGGTAATGLGQTLTSTSGNSNGLKLTINGGVLGSRGTVAFNRGIADQLNTALTSILDPTNGTIAAATTGLNSMITNLTNQETVLQGQLAVTQQRYLDEFNAMDSLVSSLQSTSNYLTQELASISGSSSSSSSTKIG